MGFCFWWDYMYGYRLTTTDFGLILQLIHANGVVAKQNQEKYGFGYTETSDEFRLDCCGYESFVVQIGDCRKYYECDTNKEKYAYIVKCILLIMKHVIGHHFKISGDGWDDAENETDIVQELKLDSKRIFTKDPNVTSLQKTNRMNVMTVSGFIREMKHSSNPHEITNLIISFYNAIDVDRDLTFKSGDILNVSQLQSSSSLRISRFVTVSTDCSNWSLRDIDSLRNSIRNYNPKGGCIVIVGDEIINNGTITAYDSGYYGWNGPGYASITTRIDGKCVCGSYGTKGRSQCKIYGNERLSELYHGSGTSKLPNRGGGTIAIKCNTFINYGYISCDGGVYSSGGSILIIAKKFINLGEITATSNWPCCDSCALCGDGRIAIYADSVDSTGEIKPKYYRNSYQNGAHLSLKLVTKWRRTCGVCKENVATKKCSACKHVYYCSVQCQSNDWNQHKIHCEKLKEANWII